MHALELCYHCFYDMCFNCIYYSRFKKKFDEAEALEEKGEYVQAKVLYEEALPLAGGINNKVVRCRIGTLYGIIKEMKDIESTN